MCLYGLRLTTDLSAVRARGVRLVWTAHNDVSHEAGHPRVEAIVGRIVASFARAVIVHERARLDRYPSGVVIPHGTLREAHGSAIPAPEARRTLGLDRPGRVILHLGRIRPYKGVEELLDAWTRTRLGEQHTLLIAGAVPDAHFKARLMARANQSRGVILRPEFVPDHEVPLYLGAADLVALPYRAVATSGSLVLALSYGRPLIVPRLPSLIEAGGVEHGVLTYDPGMPQGLDRALCAAVEGDLATLTEAAAQAGADLLDWGAIARMTLEVYRRGMEAGRP